MKNGNMPINPITYPDCSPRDGCSGLTKREAFAMAAMQGFLSSDVRGTETEFAENSVSMADALLKALEAKK